LYEPFDERDSVFARTRLVPGTEVYNDFYIRRPEYQQADDRTRNLKNLASPGTKLYLAEEGALIEAISHSSDLFAAAVERTSSGKYTQTPDGLGAKLEPHEHKLSSLSPEHLSEFAKNAALFLGADDVGITKLDPGFVYTHRGRPSDKFGDEVVLNHTHAIVMVFAMRHEYVLSGPQYSSTAETTRNYARAGFASHSLAGTFEGLGIDTRAHVDSNYLVICPPLAVQAGLGELGRNGILVHHKYGPGVRLGLVTVDAEMAVDKPQSFGISEFCRTCAKCARECPSASIPKGDAEIVRGAKKWPILPERCYHYWRTQGSDCGICIRACPFAKPDSKLHRMVRSSIKSTPIFNRLFLWGHDLVYGKSAGPKKPPHLNIKSSN